MTPTRIMLANCLLFIVIVAVSVMMLTQENTLPGPPPIRELVQEVNSRLAVEGPQGDIQGTVHDSVGKVDFFAPLIPLPTATPAPSPTPEKAPPLDDVIAEWKLQAVLSRLAVVQQIKTREEFQMKVGESKTVKFRNKDYEIKLDSINKAKWAANFTMDAMGEVQTKTLSVF